MTCRIWWPSRAPRMWRWHSAASCWSSLRPHWSHCAGARSSMPLRRVASRVARGPMMAVTAIGIFFSQVTPNLVGDGVRVWLLTRLGKSWREGLLSVIIDRAVGVGALVALAFCVFLFPSRFLALEESRSGILIFFGAALAVGVSAAILAPQYVPALLRWSGHALDRPPRAGRQQSAHASPKWTADHCDRGSCAAAFPSSPCGCLPPRRDSTSRCWTRPPCLRS